MSVASGFRSVAGFCMVVGVLVAAACSDGSGPRPPVSSLEIVGGMNQSARVNTPLPVPIRIRALSISRDPISDVMISFWPVDGASGTLERGFRYTNGDGIAATTWTLGASPGIQTIEACTNPLILPVVCITVSATATE